VCSSDLFPQFIALMEGVGARFSGSAGRPR